MSAASFNFAFAIILFFRLPERVKENRLLYKNYEKRVKDPRCNDKYITIRDSLSPDQAYARLAVAIVEQAAKDANGYSGWVYGSKKNAIERMQLVEFNRDWQKEEVKQFFNDINSIFSLCMPNTDGPTLYKMIMRNYEVYGSYIPPSSRPAFGGGIML